MSRGRVVDSYQRHGLCVRLRHQQFGQIHAKLAFLAAKLADLRDSFSALSDIPDDIQALEATVNQASVVADKFNDYAELITQLRNDAQTDINSSVNTVNALLQEITNVRLNLNYYIDSESEDNSL